MYLTHADYLMMGGTVEDDALYGRLEYRARALLDAETHGRVKGEDPARESVKRCMLELIDQLAEQRALDASAPAGIASQSNDGVSVSYAGRAATDAALQVRQRETMALHLMDETVEIDGTPVPLLYAGVEFDGGNAS